MATKSKQTKGKSKSKSVHETVGGDAGDAAAESAPQATSAPTLQDVAEGYLAAIEKHDAGPGTLSSYRMELKLAMRELGETTQLDELTPEQVQAYFGCDAVMRTRHGKHKAKATIDKSRRVLRLALVWAQDAGLIAVAPLPQAPNKAAPLALV